ncbi:hypothetical protein GW17_00028819, partial [Ensete ventricosum]
AWTWLVRPRKVSVVTTNGAGLDAGERCSAPEFPNGRSCDMSPPSSAKMLVENLLCLPSRCSLPPRLLSEHYWFSPVCASSPAIVSVQSRSLCRGKGFSSGRPLVPKRRSGRVGSRCDPSDGQVSLVVDFTTPLLRRDAGAFIVIVTGHPYLRSLLCMLLTMPSYFVAASVVLTVRCAACSLPLGNIGLAPLTSVRSVVRRLTLLCLCQAGPNHIGSATSLVQLSGGKDVVEATDVRVSLSPQCVLLSNHRIVRDNTHYSVMPNWDDTSTSEHKANLFLSL